MWFPQGFLFKGNTTDKIKLVRKQFSQIWLHPRCENQKKKKLFLYSWLPTGTYHLNLAIWIFFL
jgi:hypothetical protein